MHNKKLHLRIDEQTKHSLKAIAKELLIPESQFVREAIREKIMRESRRQKQYLPVKFYGIEPAKNEVK